MIFFCIFYNLITVTKLEYRLKHVTLRTISIILIFSIFAAILFETFHAGHEEHCHEENCPICLILKIFKPSINTAVLEIFAKSTAVFILFSIIIKLLPHSLPVNTLIAQKIKLTN